VPALEELGYTAAEISGLLADGAVRAAQEDANA
jgi:hypothetical protein